MGKRKNKRRPKGAQEAKRGADALANATQGRARRFKDRHKAASKKACRGKVEL